MKYLKEYKLFESINDRIKELFYDTMDENLRVFVRESTSSVVNFPESGVINTHHLGDYTDIGVSEDITEVSISKYEIMDGQPQLGVFNIDDVIDNVLFAESYIKSELGLCIKWVYLMKIPSYTYYKSINDVPKNLKLNKIQIGFGKI